MHKNHIRFWGTVIYLLTALFCLYSCAVQVFPSVVVYPIMRDFDLTARGYGLLVSVYFYGYIAMQIPVGLLFDRFSKRIIIFSAVVLMSLGCIIFSVAENAFLLALSRFIMGMGSAFSFVGLYVASARWFSPALFALLAGLGQLAGTFGSIIGQVPLSFVTRDFGWRAAVQWLGWVGLAIAALCIVFIRKHPTHSFVPCEVCAKPSIRTVIANRYNWLYGFFAFCTWGPILIFASLWGIPFLMVRYGVPSTTAAIMASMVWLGVGLLSPVAGWVSKFIKKPSGIMWASALLGIVASCLLIYVDVSIAIAYVLLFVLGAASASHILSYSLAKEKNAKKMVATSLSLINLILLIAGVILQPITGAILSWVGHPQMINGMRMYNLFQYQCAFLLIPILYFFAFCISAFFLKDVRKKA